MKFDWAKRLLLVDFDGVMVNFNPTYDMFMYERGYHIINPKGYDVGFRYNAPREVIYEEMHNFAASELFHTMPSMPYARSAISQLQDKGWVFHCITAAPKECYAERMLHAEMLYGKGVFQRLYCIGLNNCKREYLAKYKDTNCFWIEDRPENALLGLEYGLRPILLHHEYNDDFDHPDVYRAKDWYDILNEVDQEVDEF